MEVYMRLKDKLASGEFAILTEMEPPKGVDVSGMVSGASKVKGAVDAFVVPEMSNAVMRMSALGGAMILQGKGMETVMQISCRDRNRLALQADLLAAYGCGIQNIMAVTGEEPNYGDHHQAKAVYDITISEMLKGIKTLQSGKDMAGIELLGAPKFFTGATLNTGAKGEDLEKELLLMKEKIESDVGFFITPPLFDIDDLKSFLKHTDTGNAVIIPTVLLLKSVGMARYMARSMDHINIPDDLIKRIQKAGDKVHECILIAKEMVKSVKAEGFGGVMISTMGWEARLPEILGGMGV
jgi:5,10-methylenetetrahydrofolate reductase